MCNTYQLFILIREMIYYLQFANAVSSGKMQNLNYQYKNK